MSCNYENQGAEQGQTWQQGIEKVREKKIYPQNNTQELQRGIE